MEVNTMKRKIVNPWTWQDKFGFVQANDVSDVQRMIFCAGIVSVDEDGNLLHPNDMEKQMEQVLDNIETRLKEAGTNLSHVVKFTYYTTDVAAFGNAAATVLANRLTKGNCKPATSLIGVASLFHPDCVVEIEATAIV